MSERASAASVTPIGAARHRLDPEGRARLANVLRKIAGAIEEDLLAAGHPYAVAMAILTDDLPTAWVAGVVDRDDVAALRQVLDGIHASFWQVPKEGEAPKTAEQVVQERHRAQRRADAVGETERAADRAANPWFCEYCHRRFATERGATRHERQCWRDPGADRYGPRGKYQPTQLRDGIAHGFELGVDPKGEAASPKAPPSGAITGEEQDAR